MASPSSPSAPESAPAENGTSKTLAIEGLIEEAEQVRGLLQDALNRLARVVSALKQQRRQSKVVQQAMASLRQLQWDH